MQQLYIVLVTLLAFFAASLGQVQARVIISEFLAVNDKDLKDADGDHVRTGSSFTTPATPRSTWLAGR